MNLSCENAKISTKEIIEKLFEEIKKEELPNYWVEKTKVTVTDALNLTNCEMKKAIRFKECTFKEEVIFTYATFYETVEFENCVFEKKVDCGSEAHDHTVFKKEVIFKDCTFLSDFWFCGGICEGFADFSSSKFADVNFKSANFGYCPQKCVNFQDL